MNGTPVLNEGFTQIQNEVLEEIFIKGLLSGTEMRIALYIIRQSTGFHREWTNETTIQKVAADIGIRRQFISTTINQMVRENKIIKEGNKYRFNENYKEWKVTSKVDMTSKVDTEEVTSKVDGKCPVNRTQVTSKVDTAPSNNTQQINALEIPKYTLNIINKEERNIKERKIINNSFLNEKDFKDKEEERQGSSPAKISFNNKTFKFENIPKEKIDKWTEAFNLNVEQELKKMEAWLAANPSKHKKNYEKFIVNWLSRGGKDGKSRQGISRFVPISAGSYKEEGLDANAGEW